jgi:hypothetical protein
MQAIKKPQFPAQTAPTYPAMAVALGNAVGRYCSFCEKPLTYRLRLFHKQRGVLADNASLTAQDWPSLLLICGDCSTAASTNSTTPFNPNLAYYWPDTDAANQVAFLYNLVSNVTFIAHKPDGSVLEQTTGSAVLVTRATDIDPQTAAAALNTGSLFQLNGRFFNGNLSQPAYILTEDEYMVATDLRPMARLDAYERGVEAGTAAAQAMTRLPLGQKYVRNVLAMLDISLKLIGFHSTWRSAVFATLNGIDQQLVPRIVALLNQTPDAPIDPPVERGRKRLARDFDTGMGDADLKRRDKKARVDQTLSQAIKTKS